MFRLRGCLIFIAAFVLGAGLMLFLWPHQPKGVSVAGPADLRVTISDAFLSRAVQSQVSGQSIPSISHVRVSSIPPNALSVDADLGVGSVTTHATTEMQPEATGGTIRVHVIQSTVGGVPVPSQLSFFLENSINDNISHLLSGHAHITGVVVHPSAMEIDANYG